MIHNNKKSSEYSSPLEPEKRTLSIEQKPHITLVLTTEGICHFPSIVYIKLYDLFLNSLGAGQLVAKVLGSSNHVAESRIDFSILACLEATVGVNPENIALEDCKHLVDPVSNFFCRWDPRGMDIVHTRANASTVLHSLAED